MSAGRERGQCWYWDCVLLALGPGSGKQGILHPTRVKTCWCFCRGCSELGRDLPCQHGEPSAGVPSPPVRDGAVLSSLSWVLTAFAPTMLLLPKLHPFSSSF